MWLVDIMGPLVEIDSLKLGDIMVEAGKNNIGHDLVGEACLTNVFDGDGAWNLFGLEGLSELFVGHGVFFGFAEAVEFLQCLPGIGK